MLVVVFVASLAVLGFRAGDAGLASGHIDPVGQIGAQDEALYSHSAIRMARQGGWLTPMFLGRFGLYKPPVLAWLAGASARTFGVSPLSLRLPSLLAAALVCTFAFAWVNAANPAGAAWAVVVLLWSNHLWHVLARMCLTDALLSASFVAAMFAIRRDPALERRGPFFGFAIAAAAAIMIKAYAGLMPLIALAIFCALSRTRPRPVRLAQLGWLIATLALPWHLYQLAVHPNWFWTVYVQNELLIYGAGNPAQTSQDSQVAFYAGRLWALDPPLAVLAVIALPLAVWRVRREPVLLAWIGAVVLGVLAFRYRNVTYLLPLIPALAIAVGKFAVRPNPAGVLLVTACAVFSVKTLFPDQPWGLCYRSGTTVEAAPALDAYASKRRSRELILIEPDDHLYAAVLPLQRVRYCFVGLGELQAHALDFRGLGIVVSGDEFLELDRHLPAFRERLRAMDLDSTDPVATTILAASREQVVDIIRARPRSDFLLPAHYRDLVIPLPDHAVEEAPRSKLLLLAQQ
ncbi:MAG: ArnT family glycosyltransferase [Bryobacteraceae bacterium]